MELLKFINVNKDFGNKKILKNVNLEIPRGKIVGLLGKNGTGKSTLIKLVNDLLTPTSGEVLVNGKNVGAESKKIIVAFENLRGIDNLLQIMERYNDREYVKYCYDCGHEFGYTPTVDWIKTFGDKLACVHIHDNLGYDRSIDNDTHFLPFDGTFNYHEMMRKLDKYGYSGPLLLEVFRTRRADYEAMSAEEFIGTAYDRIKRISELGKL